MILHDISFLYSGRMADAGVMDAGYVDKAMAGARLVLASHCHFVITGRTPARITLKTRDFRVIAAAPRYGSVDIHFIVVLTGSLLAIKFLEGFASGIGEEVGKDFYKFVLRRQVRAWLTTYAEKKKNLWCEESDVASRIEPRLPWFDVLGEDDEDDERQTSPAKTPTSNLATEVEKLRNSTRRGMVMVVNPIARKGGSSGLEVRIDGESIGNLAERRPPQSASQPPHDDVYRRIADEILRMQRH